MSASLTSPKVPPEFTGLARMFRDRIAAEDRPGGEGMGRLTAEVRARIRRGNPIPRADALAGLAHGWRNRLPPLSRLDLEIDLNPRRKTIAIRELRLTSSAYRDTGWDETASEIGLIVALIELRIGPADYRFQWFTVAHLSLHAIARRLQRAHHGLADRAVGAEFGVAVPGGVWLGGVQRVKDHAGGGWDVALVARTFHEGKDA
jgi:hypothetical protein